MNPYYRDYSDFLSERFEGKVQKLTVDIGSTCPNRDGTLGRGGCIYCNNQAFSPDWAKRSHSVADQLARGRTFFAKKYPKMRYLAYFQSYTSTYNPIERQLAMYREALDQSDVVGLVIGTRPDCIPQSLLEALKTLKAPVILELGAETCHNTTLNTVNRCHTWECTVDAVKRSAELGFDVGLHLILGLPGENKTMMLETVKKLNELPVANVKFHQLQVLKGTLLEKMASQLPIKAFSVEEYIDLCADILEILRPDIAVERFVAQAPSEMLITPKWGLKNYQFTSLLHKELARRVQSI